MKLKHQKQLVSLTASVLLSACSTVQQNATAEPLMIQGQGSFAVGGSIIQRSGIFNSLTFSAEGQTLHGDHAYVFYQTPVGARKLPLMFLHGAGQSSKTWESTPDGREGFQNIFLRRGFAVYLIDQPRRGKAGRSTQPLSISATPDEQMWYEMFRLGVWPHLFENVQFPRGPESLNQYFRQMTPNTGPYDEEIISDAIVDLYDKAGAGILITHSQGGGPGWKTAIKSQQVCAIVAYEPGSFLFPAGEVPPEMPTTSPFAVKPVGIPLDEFMKLTKIPIILYYGDNIPEQASQYPGQDNWRIRLQMAKLWVEAINRYGGDATLIHLPNIGIKGNTHFPFSDLNNVEIADQLSIWLQKKGLDNRDAN